jgi:asparagine synthase (glutamine-hydrolysing)
MCGILGKITIRGRHESPEEFERAVGLLDHRGPDDRGAVHRVLNADVRVSLGHTRLSILDLSQAGHQPMASPRSDTCIVYNGEVYNHEEIRERLEAKGYVFQSRCDTEVVLAAYDDDPEEFVGECRGMFAIAILDGERHRLTLVRDRLGIKPLYYYWDGNQFAFASEVTALVSLSTLKLDVCQDAIRQFLLYGYIPAPLSIFTHVHKLPPAHSLTFDFQNPQPKVRRYWDAGDYYATPRSFQSEEDVLDALRDELTKAVRYRLISDVPLGTFLSGGIDSSLVVSLMRQIHSGPLKTFTIGFSVPQWNEAPAAKAISEHLGTQHEEYYLSEENILSAARSASEHYDEPFADESNIPMLALSRMTRRSVTVALSGDGLDELFWGYTNYQSRSMPYYELLRYIPASIRKAIGVAMQLRRGTLWSEWGAWIGFRDFAEFFVRPTVWRPGYYPRLQLQRSDNNSLMEIGRRATARLAEQDKDLLSGAIDLHGYMVDDILTKVDRASMAVSLEARVPCLDHHVVQLAASIPLAFKTAGGEPKHLPKALLGRYLPRHLWDRPKQGFGVPLVHWLRDSLKDWAHDELGSRTTRLHDWLDRAELQAMLDDHTSGRRDVARLIWGCAQLAGWDRRVAGIRAAALSTASAGAQGC